MPTERPVPPDECAVRVESGNLVVFGTTGFHVECYDDTEAERLAAALRRSPPVTLATDDQLRAEATARGYVLHSTLFSITAQQLRREVPTLRQRLDTLEAAAQAAGLTLPNP